MTKLPPRWDHQQLEYEQNALRPKLMLAWSPRLGKSRGAVDFLVVTRDSLLKASRSPFRAVLTAPLTVCPQWVELLTQAGFPVIKGYSCPIPRVGTLLKGRTEGVLVMNDERLSGLLSVLLQWAPQAYIGDESHRFRGVSSSRGKAMRKLAWSCSHVRLLTGTPTPNHLGNLWGQLVAVDKEMWGVSYERFARRYLIRDTMFKSKVLGILHPEEIREKLLACSSILRREDVFGPDQWQEITRQVCLPPKAQALYQSLVNEWVVENALSEGELFDFTHALKRMVRLQQLTSGFLPDESGQVHLIHTAKIDAVFADLEEIMESGEKVVIFHRFVQEGTAYYERAKNTYGADRVFQLNGSVDGTARAANTDAFNKRDGCAVYIVQTQSGGIGVSYASAIHAFFVSQVFNLDDELQARDRIYSPGCRKCITRFRVPHSIDDYIAQILSNKMNMHEALTKASISDIAFGGQICTVE